MIVVGTPLVGLTFSLPGDGLIGFAAAAAYSALVMLVVPDRETLARARPRSAAAPDELQDPRPDASEGSLGAKPPG